MIHLIMSSRQAYLSVCKSLKLATKFTLSGLGAKVSCEESIKWDRGGWNTVLSSFSQSGRGIYRRMNVKIPLKEDNNGKKCWEVNSCLRNTAGEDSSWNWVELVIEAYQKQQVQKWGTQVMLLPNLKPTWQRKEIFYFCLELV